MCPTHSAHSQRGTVLIITLWTITLLTILVTVLAGQSRLSARAAQFHHEEVQNWASISAAMNQAEMELILDLMDPPQLSPAEQAENPVPPRYRYYRGEPVQLAWPQDEAIVVRVWDHGGKINLNEIGRGRLRELLQKKLGDKAALGQVDDLMSAWNDWLDLNNQPGPNGAEADYYGGLDLPYAPRNGRLETVEEVLQIRGFAEVFADVDLDAAFTVYGDLEQVNLNIATVEAMRLMPGLDEELIDNIIEWRNSNLFVGNGDIAQLVPADRMAELRPWVQSRNTSTFFTIMAYRGQSPDNAAYSNNAALAITDDRPVIEDPFDTATTAYAEIVNIASFDAKPRVLKINPYQNIPIRKVVNPAEGSR
jgi:general secretion pathway protein K